MWRMANKGTWRAARSAAAGVAIGWLLLASAASAAQLPNDLSIPNNYDCRQTFADYGPTGIPSWVVADRGHLRLHVSGTTGKPTSYEFNAFWLTNQAQAGGWSWNGLAQFHSGPLAQRQGWPTVVGHWYAKPRVMPHDNVRGRTASLVLVSRGPGSSNYAPARQGREGRDGSQKSYWYCGRHGVIPRALFGSVISRVKRKTGLQVRLPTWFQTLTQGAEPGERGVVRTALKNTYRLDIVRRHCHSSCAVGIFQARRASARELGHRNPVKLAHGVRGWVGGVGCGVHPGPDWGPVYCGMNVIVWHADGINYAIQEPDADNSLLVAYADQMIRYG
jgi:hypothetical protein